MSADQQGLGDASKDLRFRALLRELGHTLAHDLGSPVRKTVAFAEFLGEDLGADLDPDSQESLDCLLASAREAQSRLARIVLWARLPEAPGTASSTTLEVLLGAAGKLRSGLAWSTDDGGERIQGDPALWAQLLAELLHNAAVYAPGEPPELLYQPENGELVLRDRGAGLDEDQLAQASEPFQRFVGASEVPGTGLGLAIAKRIAALLGLRIELRSGAPGLLVQISGILAC